MGYVGFDELSPLTKSGNKQMNFAKTDAEDAAGQGYATRAPGNKNDNFHVKWHPVKGSNVVDRFHVKNESLLRAIYYEIDLAKGLRYFQAGPSGNPTQRPPNTKYLADDCDDIANDFLNSIHRANIKVYDTRAAAQAAYDARKNAQQTDKQRATERDDAAREYTVTWIGLPMPIRNKTPKLNQELRAMTVTQIKEATAALQLLMPQPEPVATTVHTPIFVAAPIPQGQQFIPGPTPHIAALPTGPGAPVQRT